MAAAAISCVFRGLWRNSVITANSCLRLTTKPAVLFSSNTGGSEQKLCKGINYLKEGSDPPLLPDSEYPEWLWNILDDDKKLSIGNQCLDINNTTHRRRKRKSQRRQENAMRKQNK